tara:strand:+ start:149 stop:484 length:336 start_codon:yes stop_codon:yes gene_type:complete
MERIYEVSNNASSYSADAGEPDTGWLPGGDTRTLGFESGKPEPWFHQGGYEQVDFPTASFIYGSKINDKKYGKHVTKSAPIETLDDILRSLDATIEETKFHTEELYREIKR